MAFQGVLVVTLSLCLNLDGVVHPRAHPGFGPTSVRNALNIPSNGWNCINMRLIIQPGWNELGWNNQFCRGSASSQISQDLPRFAAARCPDLGFFGMSWRSGQVLLEFLPSQHPEGSYQTVQCPLSLRDWVQFCILITELWNPACNFPHKQSRKQLSLYGISLQKWVNSK